jgi:hypothetical protein
MQQPKRDDDDEPVSIGRRNSGVRRAQRANERTSVELPVSVLYSDGTVIRGVAKNLSIGGAYVEVDAPAPFGASVVLLISLPGLAERAQIEAVVRWNTPYGMGVQFGLMGARATHALTEAIRG